MTEPKVQYCTECSDYVELTPYGEKKCFQCNPQWMEDDGQMELDFEDSLFYRADGDE